VQKNMAGRGKPPLVGGVSMSDPPTMTGVVTPDMHLQIVEHRTRGTLGGLLVSDTDSVAHSYRVYALTNYHVMDNPPLATQGCQPASELLAGECQPLGKLVGNSTGTGIVACCSASGESPSDVMDAAIVEIDTADRFNHMCSVITSMTPNKNARGTALSVTTQVKHVSGMSMPIQGGAVWKYGATTHLTYGNVSLISARQYTVRPLGWPQFVDHNPTDAPGFPGIKNPVNDDYFTNCVLKSWRDHFTDMIRPDLLSTTRQRVTQADADSLFNALFQAGRVLGAFDCKGDSGSWLFRDGSTPDTAIAIGLNNAGAWIETERNVGTPVTMWGTKWWNWHYDMFGFTMPTVLNMMNRNLTSIGLSNVQVCVEADRRATLGPAPSCSSAFVAATKTCAFPMSCKLNTRKNGCMRRGVTGV